VASRLPAAMQAGRIMLVLAGKVLKDDAPLLKSASGSSLVGTGALGDPAHDVVHVVLVKGASAPGGEERQNAAAVPPHTPAPSLAAPPPPPLDLPPGQTSEPARPALPSLKQAEAGVAVGVIGTLAGAEGGGRPGAVAAVAAAPGATPVLLEPQGRDVAPATSAAGGAGEEVFGTGGNVIRVEIEVSADGGGDSEEEEEEEEEETLAMLVATSVTIGELMAAASARLVSCGRGGQCVESLEFGGRVLAASDALSLLLRSDPPYLLHLPLI